MAEFKVWVDDEGLRLTNMQEDTIVNELRWVLERNLYPEWFAVEEIDI